MRKPIFLFLGLTVFFAARPDALFAASKIKIVATTSTFASIAKDIAGDKAEIYFIASPNRDIHFISPTPRDMMKLKNADVFIHAGLDLEAWRGPLLDAVGRLDLMWPTGERQIDLSKGISLLEIPGSLSRAQGDIHAYGNPHYWLDPLNGKIIAQNIADGLTRLYPQDADFFRKNLQEFDHKMDAKLKEWQGQLAPYKGAGVVPYHNSWPYFIERFGLVTLGYLEPKPGIPPTPKHMEELIQRMKEKGGKVLIKEVFHENRTPKKIAKETGAAIATLATEAGETKGDYFSLFDEDIHQLADALSKASSGNSKVS